MTSANRLRWTVRGLAVALPLAVAVLAASERLDDHVVGASLSLAVLVLYLFLLVAMSALLEELNRSHIDWLGAFVLSLFFAPAVALVLSFLPAAREGRDDGTGAVDFALLFAGALGLWIGIVINSHSHTLTTEVVGMCSLWLLPWVTLKFHRAGSIRLLLRLGIGLLACQLAWSIVRAWSTARPIGEPDTAWSRYALAWLALGVAGAATAVWDGRRRGLKWRRWVFVNLIAPFPGAVVYALAPSARIGGMPITRLFKEFESHYEAMKQAETRRISGRDGTAGWGIAETAWTNACNFIQLKYRLGDDELERFKALHDSSQEPVWPFR